MMRQMSNSLREDDASSSFLSRLAKFFSNPFYDFRLASHVVFLV